MSGVEYEVWQRWLEISGEIPVDSTDLTVVRNDEDADARRRCVRRDAIAIAVGVIVTRPTTVIVLVVNQGTEVGVYGRMLQAACGPAWVGPEVTTFALTGEEVWRNLSEDRSLRVCITTSARAPRILRGVDADCVITTAANASETRKLWETFAQVVVPLLRMKSMAWFHVGPSAIGSVLEREWVTGTYIERLAALSMSSTAT